MARIADKNKLLSSQAAISADTTETTLGNAGWFDMRGAEDLRIAFQSTVNTGFVSTTNYFVGEVWGKHTDDGTAFLVAATAELVVNVAQILGDEGDGGDGEVVWPRYLQIRWNETGTISSFTATAYAYFNRKKVGSQVTNGPLS